MDKSKKLKIAKYFYKIMQNIKIANIAKNNFTKAFICI